MYRQLAITVVLAAALLIAIAAPSNSTEKMKKLKAGDITVTYPAGLEDKAKELAEFATKNILPERDRFLKTTKVFSDTDKVSKRIVEWLGCPEEQKEAEEAFAGCSKTTDSLEKMFTDIRLYRKSDIKSSGGVSEGPITLSYDRATDHLQFKLWVSGADQEAFLPVLLGEDGEFDFGGPLTEAAEGIRSMLTNMLLIVSHEAAESVLVSRLKLYHPYARWFNDGVANWVGLRITDEFAPDQRKEFRSSLMPVSGDTSVRSTINLLTWLQMGFMPGNSFREKTEGNDPTNYAYATEAVVRILRGLPPDTLAKIIGKLKGKYYADTDMICTAIQEVTGRNAKAILLEYVPAHVKEGLAKNEDVSLYGKARGLVGEKDYMEICRLLQASIEMRPGNKDAHFNLAWAMRKSGAPKELSERELVIAYAVAYDSTDRVDLFTKDEEAVYLLGRMWQISRVDDDKAREHFKRVLKTNPSHADAIAALAELDKATPRDKQ